MFILRSIGVALFIIVPISAREFEDEKGRKVEATLTGVEGEYAFLKSSNGTVARFPISKLSDKDQEYVRNHPIVSLPPIEIPKDRMITVSRSNKKPIYITNTGKNVDIKDLVAIYTPNPGQEVFSATVYQGTSSFECFIDHQANIRLKRTKEYFLSTQSEWSDSLIRVGIYTKDKKVKSGFIDHKGKIVIRNLDYGFIDRMVDNRAWVAKDRENKRYILINEKGDIVKKMDTSIVGARLFNSGLSLVTKKLGEGHYQYFYVNTKGDKAFDLTFSSKDNDQVDSYKNGFAVVNKGILNAEGKWTVEPVKYSPLKSVEVTDGVVIVSKTQERNQYAVVAAATGKVVCYAPENHYLDYRSSDGYIVTTHKETRLSGLMDRTGNIILPAKYKDLKPFVAGFSSYKDKDGKTIHINIKGKVIAR